MIGAPPSDLTQGERLLLHDVIAYHLANGVANEDELFRFSCALLWGRRPIRSNTCEKHHSPWSFVASSFFGKATEHVVIATRSGYKTSSLSLLNSLMLLLKPGISLIHLGSKLYQAHRGNSLTRTLLAHTALKDLGMVERDTDQTIILANGSKLEIVAATISGANSPHANVVGVDEFELIRDEQVINEVRFAGNSYGGYKAQFVWLSSLKRRDGFASKAVEESKPIWHGRPSHSGKNFLPPLKARHRRLMGWCYREVSEPCPEWRRGTKKEFYEIDDIFHPGEKIVVESWEKCGACPLFLTCRGSLSESQGDIPIDDLIGEFVKVDRSSWLASKECTFAEDTGSRVYPEFTKTKHVYHGPAYDARLPVVLILDPGGGQAASAIGIFALDYAAGLIRQVGEMVSTGHTVEQDATTLVAALRLLGVRAIFRAFADPTAGQAVIEWNERLAGLCRFSAVLRPKKLEMVAALSSMIAPVSGGQPRILWHESCHTAIRQLASYRRQAFSEEPIDGDDDAVDVCHYIAWVTGPGAERHGMHPMAPRFIGGPRSEAMLESPAVVEVGSKTLEAEARLQLAQMLRRMEGDDDE